MNAAIKCFATLVMAVGCLTVQIQCGGSASGIERPGSETPPIPAAPSIASFVADSPMVTSGGTIRLVGVFSNGSGVITPGNLPVTSGMAVSVSPAVNTTYTLTVTGPAGAQAEHTVQVDLVAAPPTITRFLADPPAITMGGTANLAGVFGNGSGVITPGDLSATSGMAITVAPGSTTTYTLTVTDSAGTAVAQTATVTVVPPPVAPVISVPANLPAGATGLIASVSSQNLSTYAWTITGGIITAGDGTSQISFSAGNSGSVLLGCVVTNAAGSSSPRALATCGIIAAPVISAFAASSTIVTQENAAILSFSFSGGTGVLGPGGITVTSGGTLNISSSGGALTPEPASSTTFTLTVTNVLGASVQSQVTITFVPPPAISSFAASPGVAAPGSPVRLMPVFANGTGTIDHGLGPVASGTPLIVTPSVATAYNLTVTNPAGATVTAQATVAMTGSGAATIYALGGNGYWKNGVWVPRPNGALGNIASLVASGNDVYVLCSNDFDLPGQPGYFLNGAWVGLPPPPDHSVRGQVNALVVAGTDVYAGGWCSASLKGLDWVPGYWLNGAWIGLALPPGASSNGQVNTLVVVGSDVYAGGWNSNAADIAPLVPGYWLNGAWVGLAPPFLSGFTEGVTSLVVSGSDVYAAGSGTYVFDHGYWLNGTWVSLAPPGGATGASITSLVVSGSDLYAAGFSSSYYTRSLPGYWLNGTLVLLPMPADSTGESATSLAVHGTDVYVSGDLFIQGVTYPGYWLNGTWVALPMPPGSITSGVSSIVVQ